MSHEQNLRMWYILTIGFFSLVVLIFFFESDARAQTQESNENNLSEDEASKLENNLTQFIDDVEERLASIETDVKNINQRLSDDNSTILKVSENTLLSTERTFTKIVWVVGFVATIITLAAGLLAYFGFKEKKDIDNLKLQAQQELEKIQKKSSEVNEDLGKFRSILESLQDDFRKFQKAELNLKIADDYIRSGLSYKEGLRILKEVLDEDSIDDRIKAKAYAKKGFALKRLHRIPEAFSALECAIELDFDNPIYVLNCACYSALNNDVENTLKYLDKGLDKWKDTNRIDFKSLFQGELNKLSDNDFASIKNESVFKEFLSKYKISTNYI